MTTNGDTSSLPAAAEEFHPAGAQRSGIENIFIGPNGMRAGWRLLIFIILMFACLQAEGFTLKRVPGVDAWFKTQDPHVMTAPVMLFTEGILLLALVISTAVMTLIEKRTYADYYLPPNQFLGKRFWQGVPYGFAMLSLALGLIAALHGFSLGSVALSGADALKFGALYGIAFLMVGLFEEFSFRGYMQATLGPGIGFWPAAIVLSILFGAIHLNNLGEAWFGAAMAGSFGVLASLTLPLYLVAAGSGSSNRADFNVGSAPYLRSAKKKTAVPQSRTAVTKLRRRAPYSCPCSVFSWQVMQYRVHGTASNRFCCSSSWHELHSPYVPSLIRASALSTSASSDRS